VVLLLLVPIPAVTLLLVRMIPEGRWPRAIGAALCSLAAGCLFLANGLAYGLADAGTVEPRVPTSPQYRYHEWADSMWTELMLAFQLGPSVAMLAATLALRARGHVWSLLLCWGVTPFATVLPLLVPGVLPAT
jgi:hypothetical protein